jgi:uncharacterized protein YndB with AHSA1/START domain
MLHVPTYEPDPSRDLEFERVVDVAPELVWQAWTDPEHLKKWFTPPPWKTVACEIDLRRGGRFRTVMQGPDGEEVDSSGCYLEIVEHELLVFTDALGPGYRPVEKPFFTAMVSLAHEGAGTRYTARAIHGSLEARDQHESMGFHEGWGTALEQLVTVMKAVAAGAAP